MTDAGTPGVSDPGLSVDSRRPLRRPPGRARARPVVGHRRPGRVGLAHACLLLSRLPAAHHATRRKFFAQHADSDTTLLVFESPHRVLAALATWSPRSGPDRPCAIGRELTKHFEEVFRGTAAAALGALRATSAARRVHSRDRRQNRAAPGSHRMKPRAGLVDTHAHLMDVAFDADRDDVLAAAKRAG